MFDPENMPKYFYKAKNIKGEEQEGILDALNLSQLAKILRQREYYLISAEESNNIEKDKKIFNLGIFKGLFGISIKEKLFFTKNLGLMIKTGVPLPRVFKILIKQTKNKRFKEVLTQISQRITKGENFFQALNEYPKIFPKIYRETLRIGEETGKIEDSLIILSRQMEREYKLKSKIKTAMVYPLMVLATGIIIGIMMFILVIPNLKAVFKEFKTELPFTTKIMLAFSDFLVNRWQLSLIVLSILGFFLISFIKKGKEGKVLGRLVLIMPIISNLVRDINSALILRILSSLFAAGVPVVRSLEITSESLNNFYYKQSLKQAAKDVKKGDKLSQVFQNYTNLYSSSVVEMMRIGEETGETSKVLENLADFYEEEVNAELEKLSSVIEPFLIIVMGVIVGFFAVSMMQPMFSVIGGL